MVSVGQTVPLNHVTDLYALNRTLLAPVTGLFNDVLDRSLTAIKDTDAQVNYLACRLDLIFYRFYVLSLNPFPLRFCNYSSPRLQLLPFTIGILTQWPVRKVRFPAVWLEVWSSTALRLSRSDSRASACSAVLGRRRLSWPEFSRGIPNASSSALQHSR